jgi:hypothetical protein
LFPRVFTYQPAETPKTRFPGVFSPASFLSKNPLKTVEPRRPGGALKCAEELWGAPGAAAHPGPHEDVHNLLHMRAGLAV